MSRPNNRAVRSIVRRTMAWGPARRRRKASVDFKARVYGIEPARPVVRPRRRKFRRLENAVRKIAQRMTRSRQA